MDEFAYVEMIGDEVALKEQKGENEATLNLIEQLHKEEYE